jgi:4-amino-4-deoxy-L-arabinose transferase-like glycosyltransferase
VNQPTPAIVTQEAVRRLPRAILLLFCLGYVMPGFVGREPWKSADITGFGHMLELARGSAPWLAPTLLGQPPEFDALLPYWLGAWAIRIAPAWMPADLAARVPFALLLVLTLAATWWGVYFLSRSPKAQPVPFAFGGEASPSDYARAMADGGLLALVASLGLAQFSHETTPSLAQIACTATAFYGMAALPYRTAGGILALFLGLVGLALSGGPSMAVLFGVGALVIALIDRDHGEPLPRLAPWQQAVVIACAIALAAVIASWLNLWHWRIGESPLSRDWRAFGRLLLWFTWPAWPLVLWTLWCWRRQLTSRHVALPLWFASVAIVTSGLTASSDRSMLLGLPAMATLAAFALPTLRRSVSALIDWFTLLFFSGCALVIWVIWLSMQTGIPPKPAANIARLAPGFVPSFSLVALAAALLATLAWGALVRWRTGRHRHAIWKSLVLPAAGAALCWLLLMTLWLPVLDYARSYTPLVRAVLKQMDRPGCVEELGLSRAQIAAFMYHGNMHLRAAGWTGACPWLLVAAPQQRTARLAIDMRQWRFVANVRRPADTDENVLLYRRVGGQ